LTTHSHGCLTLPRLAILAILSCCVLAVSAATASSDVNFLVNGDLKPGDHGQPIGWKESAVPGCASRFILHSEPSGGAELEIISDEASETWFEQVLTLKGGWYYFSAEVLLKSLSADSSGPELFVGDSSMKVQGSTQGWTPGWRRIGIHFKIGAGQREVAVGGGLGVQGRPSIGNLLFRNPSLVAAEGPPSEGQGYDLEAMAASKNPRWARGGAHELRLKYPRGSNWSLGAVYLGVIAVSALGWFAVSSGRGELEPPKSNDGRST
jgi:hypothetical protein